MMPKNQPITVGELNEMIKERQQQARDNKVMEKAKETIKRLKQNRVRASELEVKHLDGVAAGIYTESGKLDLKISDSLLHIEYDCSRSKTKMKIHFNNVNVFLFDTSVLNQYEPKILAYIPGEWEELLSVDKITQLLEVARETARLQAAEVQLRTNEEKLNQSVDEQTLQKAAINFGFKF